MTPDNGPPVERRALSRLLQDLIAVELAAARGRQGQREPSRPVTWSDDLYLDDEPGGLGADSLERLWLSSAVTAMFHLHANGLGTSLHREPRFGAWLDTVQAAWNAKQARVTFTTSGSTGRPKRCTHDLSHLHTEVAFLARRFADRRRIVALAPAHHIYGCLFTVLLPSRLGIEVLDATNLSAGSLQHALRPGDLVVSFPERWQWLERSLPDWPADVQGVVSTAPCPPGLLAALLDRGLDGMTEVYGSSETAGIATRVWPESRYTLMPHWAFADPLDPERPTIRHSSGEIYALVDRVERFDKRGFALAGRLDGMVQVGGVNVDPAAVAAALETLPGVAAAAVRLMAPGEGTRLKAFVVPAGEALGLRAEIEDWLRATLAPAQRPTSLTFGPTLPVGALGKPADWAIEA